MMNWPMIIHVGHWNYKYIEVVVLPEQFNHLHNISINYIQFFLIDKENHYLFRDTIRHVTAMIRFFPLSFSKGNQYIMYCISLLHLIFITHHLSADRINSD